MRYGALTVSEAASLLRWRTSAVVDAIELGVDLPNNAGRVHLTATRVGRDYEILEESLEAMIAAFEREQPGRHPPARVCRELLLEAKHRCAICESVRPLQFHHILEFSKLKHHDPRHMLVVCGSCHGLITAGEIDLKSQRAYKARSAGSSPEPEQFRLRLCASVEPVLGVLEEEPLTALWKQCIELEVLPTRFFTIVQRVLRKISEPGAWAPLVAGTYIWFLRELEPRDRLAALEVQAFTDLIADSALNTGLRAYTALAVGLLIPDATIESLKLTTPGANGGFVLSFVAASWWKTVPADAVGDKDEALDLVTMLWSRGSPAERAHIIECFAPVSGIDPGASVQHFRTRLIHHRLQRWEALPDNERYVRRSQDVIERLKSSRPVTVDEAVSMVSRAAKYSNDDPGIWDVAAKLFDRETLDALRRHHGEVFMREMLTGLVRSREVDAAGALLAVSSLVAICGASSLVLHDGLIEALLDQSRAGDQSVLEGLAELFQSDEELDVFDYWLVSDAFQLMDEHEQAKLVRVFVERPSRAGDLVLDALQGRRAPDEVASLWNALPAD